MKRISVSIFLCLMFFNIHSLNSELFYNNFTQDILADPYSIVNYLDETDQQNSLGIMYQTDYPKFLIGNILSKDIRSYLLENPDKFQLVITDLGEEYSLLEINSEYGSMDFYLRNKQLISRADYTTRDWLSLDSEYFTFRYPASNPPNPIAVQELDDYTETVLNILACSELQIDILKKEKLDYLLCPDETTIEAVTSFKARGICLLNQDYVVSKFPAHFHEVTHLLMNYRIKENQLFTHPFLQEGFAVAMGGRGGKNAEIILDIGVFLQQSGFADYITLLDVNGFQQIDSSLSYPLSGLYSRFLIQTIGIEAYLNLYKFYSNPTGNFTTVLTTELPAETVWQRFISKVNYSTIKPNHEELSFINVLENDSLKVRKSTDYYEFKAKEQVNFDYNLGKFKVNVLGRYELNCNEFEINILDTATNNLIATYVSGFSIENIPVSCVNGYYKFFLKRDILD